MKLRRHGGIHVTTERSPGTNRSSRTAKSNIFERRPVFPVANLLTRC
jgi:hypothetical protein